MGQVSPGHLGGGAIDPFSIIFRPVKNFKVFLSGRAKNQTGRIIEWGTVSWPGLHKRGGGYWAGAKGPETCQVFKF